MKSYLIIVLFSICYAYEVKTLPGLEFDLNFKHYSGYLNASNNHRLHYWFVESQNNVSSDPLIFWFNGGPGCSSLVGLLVEHGPFLLDEDGEKLRENIHSWNKVASVVYLQSPAGVGFSYSENGDVFNNDDQNSQENYEAIKEFLQEFSQFRNHSFYLSGQSYAGFYIPTLALRILNGQKKFPINFKGMAIGNGYMDINLNQITRVVYAYTHGFGDEETYREFTNVCCQGNIETCEGLTLSSDCYSFYRNNSNKLIQTNGIDSYDINRICPYEENINPMRSHKMFRQTPCFDEHENLRFYMNKKEVRDALHIPSHVQPWKVCAFDLDQTTYTTNYDDMKFFVNKVVEKGVKTLLYYGDSDSVCNFMLGQKFSSGLGLELLGSHEPWYSDEIVSGYYTSYAGLTFLTFRGAGHSVPVTHASQMLYVLKTFLKNGKY